MSDLDTENLKVVEDSLEGVIYTHKTHEKEVDIKGQWVTILKLANIALTTATLVPLIVSFFLTGQDISTYVGAGFALLTLAFTLVRLNFNPEDKLERHRQVAKELLAIRGKHRALIVDIKNRKIAGDTLRIRRDELANELNQVYKFAPTTSSKAYELAHDAIEREGLMPPKTNQ